MYVMVIQWGRIYIFGLVDACNYVRFQYSVHSTLK